MRRSRTKRRFVDPAATSRPDTAASREVALGRLRNAIGFNLRLAQEASFRAFAKRVGDHDLKPRRYALLTIIHENPGLTQAALGRASGRDKSSITPALQDLVRRELVERRTDPKDGRVRTLWLTPKGVAVTKHLARAARAHHRFLLAAIGPENGPVFIELLNRLERACSKYDTGE
jgi:DNA-binding MarR family transcriptional regulator